MSYSHSNERLINRLFKYKLGYIAGHPIKMNCYCCLTAHGDKHYTSLLVDCVTVCLNQLCNLF